MKKLIAVISTILVATSFTGCSKTENNNAPKEKTTEVEQTQKLAPEELEKLKEKDNMSMLILLLEAETVNSKISDAVDEYNGGNADATETLNTVKSLSEDFEGVKTMFEETEWKTEEYLEKATQFKTALDGLDEFFVLIIEGLENDDYDKQDEAFKSRQIYYDNSDAVYKWFQSQQ